MKRYDYDIYAQATGEILFTKGLLGSTSWQEIEGKPGTAILENEYGDSPLIVFTGYHDREPEHIRGMLAALVARLQDKQYTCLTIPADIYLLHSATFDYFGAKISGDSYLLSITRSNQIQKP